MRIFLILTLSLIMSNSVFAQEKLQISTSLLKNAISSDVAVYNLANAKMHTHDCEWAEKCTKNCLYFNKDEVDGMFYIPCLVCGGGVFSEE